LLNILYIAMWTLIARILIFLFLLFVFESIFRECFWEYCIRCTSMKWRYFSQKKHVKFGKMIKRNLFKVCSIACYTVFPVFRTICGYHASKNLPLLPRIIHRAIFSRLRTNQSAAQQVRDLSMQTSGNRKEPSLVE